MNVHAWWSLSARQELDGRHEASSGRGDGAEVGPVEARLLVACQTHVAHYV